MQTGPVSFPDSPWLAQLLVAICPAALPFSLGGFTKPQSSVAHRDRTVSVFLKSIHPDTVQQKEIINRQTSVQHA